MMMMVMIRIMMESNFQRLFANLAIGDPGAEESGME